MSKLFQSLQFFQILIVVFVGVAAHASEENEKSCNEVATNSPLYSASEAFNRGFLKVSDIHEIYYEEYGNPNGKPILFVHGGPGAGFSSEHARFFDPKHYRIILFDQRGAGQSKPHAELRENTTWDLVADMERLRNHLHVKNWILFGGSWGSTLSLVYAETHPEKVRAMVLRGIFLCRKSEIDWFYQYGAHHIFPEAWDRYVSHIPEAERHNMVDAYYRRMTSSDPAVRLAAAREWSIWEGSASHLVPDSLAAVEADFGGEKFALAFGRIESHYFNHNIFFDSDNQILNNAGRIAHIPIEMVHGRYDIVCPIEGAVALQKQLPHANLTKTQAGHAANEPETQRALVKATDKFRSLD
jgi:proline iminopeptidase